MLNRAVFTGCCARYNHPMHTNRTQQLENAPLDELLAILLRQFKGLLATAEIDLTENEIRSLAHTMAEGEPLPDKANAMREALIAMVEESLTVLQQWDFTFEQSLRADMNAIPGWETTAEFIEIANEKGNAELRISAGATLLLALGDLRYANHALAAIAINPAELETVAARRILSRLSAVADDADDWLTQVEAWLRA